MKKGAVISVLLTVIFCSAVFFVLGLLLLPAEFESEPDPKPTDEFVSGVEYYNGVENCRLLLTFSDGAGALLYLDFGRGRIAITIYNDNPEGQAERLGYDKTLFADDNFLCLFCDRLGGIELLEGGTKRNYLSASLRQKLLDKADFETRKMIIEAFFQKIAKIGLSSGDFMFIIEETKNNLNYTVCYDWTEYIADMASNISFEKG